MVTRSIRIWALLALGTVAASQPAARPPATATSGTIVRTQQIHAAFTLNLVRFVTWPEGTFAQADAPLVVGTLPRDPINDELDAVAQNEKVEGRPVQTIRIQSLDDVAKCHVVYLSQTVGRQNAVLERTAGKPILTISDAEGFLELGGHVRFVTGGARTGLRISVDNVRASRLEVRAQLLRIAAAP